MLTRIPRHRLPDEFVKCGVPKDCPYMSSNGYCDDPRTAKSNSDAACHRMSNKELLDYLPSSVASTARATPAPLEACAKCQNTGWCHGQGWCQNSGVALSSTDRRTS